jgi:predicted Zn-dependent protease with MMP-like domain
LDAGLGLVHPPRAPDLPSEAELPGLQRATVVCVLPEDRHEESAGFGQARPTSSGQSQETGSGQAARVTGQTRPAVTAMTRAAFRSLVEEAIDTIPRRFAREVRNLAIIIEDHPSPEQLDQFDDLEPGDSLLGLYEGTPLTQRSSATPYELPDRITLFQCPIEEEAGGDEDEIVIAIGETLIHELGHYFGLEEDEIMAIEEKYWRGEDLDDEAGRREPDDGA